MHAVVDEEVHRLHAREQHRQDASADSSVKQPSESQAIRDETTDEPVSAKAERRQINAVKLPLVVGIERLQDESRSDSVGDACFEDGPWPCGTAYCVANRAREKSALWMRVYGPREARSSLAWVISSSIWAEGASWRCGAISIPRAFPSPAMRFSSSSGLYSRFLERRASA